MSKKAEYKPLGKVDRIAVTSRASVKVGESFYTVEYHEERVIPDLPEVDIVKERKDLWDTCNAECDNQIEDILKTYKN